MLVPPRETKRDRRLNPIVFLDVSVGDSRAGRLLIEVSVHRVLRRCLQTKNEDPANTSLRYPKADHLSLSSSRVQLRVDVVPKTCENFRRLCTGETRSAVSGKRRHYAHW